MAHVWVWMFVISAVLTALASLATMLMTPRPACGRDHVQQLARLGVFAGGLMAASRVLGEQGACVTWERTLLMVSLAALYGVQMLHEIRRHRRQGACA
jgi:hypothetical protein